MASCTSHFSTKHRERYPFFRLAVANVDLALIFHRCAHNDQLLTPLCQVFNMRTDGGTANAQQGIFMDNGSGGFMTDLTFNVRNLRFQMAHRDLTNISIGGQIWCILRQSTIYHTESYFQQLSNSCLHELELGKLKNVSLFLSTAHNELRDQFSSACLNGQLSGHLICFPFIQSGCDTRQ